MTIRIIYEGDELETREGETVLETLLRNGKNPQFSCRNGSCLVCLQRCVKGTPTARSQRSLRPRLQSAGYFLPCRCVPETSMELAPPRAADLFSPAVVQEKELLAPDVCRVLLEPATSLYYHAGQFINLRRTDGLVRSYSLASLPSEDPYLEIHVKRMPGGAMSDWLFDSLAVGDEVEIQGPNGRCSYVPGSQDQDLLLVGTGTGAAPLVGVARDAIHVGHRGRIIICHGSRERAGLYLHELFSRLARDHESVTYVPCVSRSGGPDGVTRGRVHDVAIREVSDLRGWRVFAAGHPAMVSELVAAALDAGAKASEIHADPHEIRPAADAARGLGGGTREIAEGASGRKIRAPMGAADPELWRALGSGELLTTILTDFYTEVFEDPLLAPYFRGVTKDRLVGQVYSFMRDILTGERRYFGMRPRTAHHWMVISDELFDHRERMMDACLRRHGLDATLVERWRKLEESFRRDIVKPEPWKLVVDGVEMPLDGFGEEEILCGTMCDGCQRAIEVGERVRYHLRLGTTFCPQCAFTKAAAGHS